MMPSLRIKLKIHHLSSNVLHYTFDEMETTPIFALNWKFLIQSCSSLGLNKTMIFVISL